MSPIYTKQEAVIRRVLEETGYAYSLSCEANHLDADYAEYASSQSLAAFRHAFQDPDLSYEELCQILRRATNREVRRQCKTPWSVFMANCIAGRSNGNHRMTGRGY